MRSVVSVLLAGVLTSSSAVRGAEPAKPQPSPEELYASLKGPWRSDDERSPLTGFWLHRNEKAAVPPPGASPWGVLLDFRGGNAEGFRGAPAKVEVECDGLRIILPAAGEGETRGTRSLLIRRDGEQMKIRVTGGNFEGAYVLKPVRSKQ
jgi:hypothetical protein